ncbi:MAG: Lrp/AsnC family transcriptional regulator [Candidatus Woesearchaeota archaeon]
MVEEVFRGQIYDNVMPQKLDLTDRKILYLLSKNARYSNTAIAKALRLKREVVAYRIKKMIDTKVINGFYTLIDTRKLGYFTHRIYMKLKTMSHEDDIINFLINVPHVSAVNTCSGMYDIYFEIMTNNLESYDKIFSMILNKCRDSIHDYTVLNLLKEDSTGRGFLIEPEEISNSRLDLFKENKGSCFQKEFNAQDISHFMVEFDDVDKSLLKLINHNSRMSIRDISSELNIAVSTVENRIKKLITDGVIKRFFPTINFSHFGVQWYIVFLIMKDTDEKKLITYLIDEPNTLWYIRYIGKWNYTINIFAENNAQFNDVLKKFRETFSENIVNFESIIIFKQHKLADHLE